MNRFEADKDKTENDLSTRMNFYTSSESVILKAYFMNRGVIYKRLWREISLNCEMEVD